MSENHHDDRPNGTDDQELGAALGEAVAGEADAAVTPPPVTDIAERAAARVKARRVRHGVVGIAAAVALIAGLVTWNPFGGNGGDGNIHVATEPTVAERAEPTAAGSPPATDGVDPGAAQPAARSTDDATANSRRAAGPPAADDAHRANMDDLAPADQPVADSPPAEPQPPDQTATGTYEGTKDPAGESTEHLPDIPTPEAVSTGPTLTWTEVSLDTSPGVVDIYRLESVGDGRITARAVGVAGDLIVVTDNGTTWTTVPTPAGIAPGQIDIAGDRWVVAGTDASGPERTDRVFFSDDEGVTWTELALEIAPVPLPGASYCVERSPVRSALASRDRIVVVVNSYTDLALQALLVERGYAPDRESILQWDYSDSALILYLGESTNPERLEIAHDELGLAPGQSPPCAGQDGAHDQRVRIYTSGASGAELVAEYEGWSSAAVSTNDGFAIDLNLIDNTGLTGALLITSTDGRNWTESIHSRSGGYTLARGSGAAIWRAGVDYIGRIQRTDIGERQRTVATFDGLILDGELAAGPAGVVTRARPQPGIESNLVPEVEIIKDGYELRLGRPTGGLTLWDLAEDVAIYEFGREMMQGDTPPPGVREVIEDDGSMTIVFEDPDSGEDLVAFATEDLVPDIEQSMGIGPLAAIQSPYWVGWSADGTDWGWRIAADAFGIDPSNSHLWIDLAVGDDFVLARVESFDMSEVVARYAATEERGPLLLPESLTTRWFIATVP